MNASEVLDYFGASINNGLSNSQRLKRPYNSVPVRIQPQSYGLYFYGAVVQGRHTIIPVHKIVEGDVIELKAGDIAPANIRLLQVKDVLVNEEWLNGTAHNIAKNTYAIKSLVPTTEQKNMIFAGTEVVHGTAKGIVVEISTKQKKQSNSVRQSTFTRRLRKKGCIVQSSHVPEVLKRIDVVVFDDLRQPTEIMTLMQKITLQKHIQTIFLVYDSIAKEVKKLEPNIVYCQNSLEIAQKATEDTLLVSCVSVEDKINVIRNLHNQGKKSLYISRGDICDDTVSRAAAISMIVGGSSCQQSLLKADIVAVSITPQVLSSLLYKH